MDQELQPAGIEHIEIEELSSFFDLLARFDFEDHKKEKQQSSETAVIRELQDNLSLHKK